MSEALPMPPGGEPTPPSLTSPRDWGQRETFDGAELARVLSHYDLGIVEGIREFRRGSRRAPKVRIRTVAGEYLLKRRATGHDDPFRVAFTHTLQLHLARQRFPVPAIIGTRHDNNSLLHLDGRVYELFEYVRGRRYDGSSDQTFASGWIMARLHALLEDCSPEYAAPIGSYHGAQIAAQFARVPAAIGTVEPDLDENSVRATCTRLRAAYEDAAARVDACGFRDTMRSMVHGDWHPGNLLYRDRRVVAVLDFDSARLEPRVADIANGALQFSMMMGDPLAPEAWPEGLDVRRMDRFIRGYDQAATRRLDDAERRALPWLIIEALVVESLVPIAATGRFARISGSRFMRMVDRKVEWIRRRADKIVAYLEGGDAG